MWEAESWTKIRVKNNLRKIGCKDVSKNGLPQDRIQLRGFVATRIINVLFHNNRGFAEFLFRENSAQWREAEIHACR
jgi:hypothetical protein